MHLGKVGLVNAAWVAAVPVVNLVFCFIAGYSQFVDIDHHDKITGIHMWGEYGLMFAAQAVCDISCEPTQNLVGCVYYEPIVYYFVRFS